VVKPGDWSTERSELLRLVEEFAIRQNIAATPEMRALRFQDDFYNALRLFPNQPDVDAACDAAEGLRRDLDGNQYSNGRTEWVLSYIEMQLALGRTAAHHNLKIEQGLRLDDSTSTLLQTLDENSLSTSAGFRCLLLAVELTLQKGFESQDRASVRRSADFAEKLIEVVSAERGGDSNSNFVHGLRIAAKALHYAGRYELRTEALELLSNFASKLRLATSAPDHLLVTQRLRCSQSAEASQFFDDPKRSAWIQTALSCNLPIDDRNEFDKFVNSVSADSEQIRFVFLAVGDLSAAATVVTNGHWTKVGLPELQGDVIGPELSVAYKSHTDATLGSISSSSDWATNRANVLSSIADKLGPLISLLEKGGSPVALFCSGWAHAIPISPLISRMLRHEVQVAAVLSPLRSGNELGRHGIEFAAVAAPGQGPNYLANAAEDAEQLTALFAGSSQCTVEPTVEAALSLILNARQVALIGHAHGSHRDPGDSHFALPKKLDLRRILTEDMSNVQVIMLAACEGLSPDAQMPQNPLSLATSFLFAGARSVIATHWRIGDQIASDFTSAFFLGMAYGCTVPEAYRTALLHSGDSSTAFVLYLDDPRELI
jgi:CHAT domain